MSAWEIISEPTLGPTGTFTPQADQTKFRSAFGVVGGTRQPGWIDGRSLEQGIPSQDGKGKLRFTKYEGTKDNKALITKWNGMDLAEYVTPIEDADAKGVHDAGISNDKVRSYLNPTSTPATDSQVGRAAKMESYGDVRATVPLETL